jgi:hypothetical protein
MGWSIVEPSSIAGSDILLGEVWENHDLASKIWYWTQLRMLWKTDHLKAVSFGRVRSIR